MEGNDSAKTMAYCLCEGPFFRRRRRIVMEAERVDLVKYFLNPQLRAFFE